MRMNVLRPLLALFALVLATLGFAGTLTVTSPSSGDYVGKSATINFNVSGANRQVRVTVTATPAGGSTSITQSKDLTPTSVDGELSDSITITFAEKTQSAYTIVVSATETGNSYASTTLDVTVDAVSPKFVTLSPASGNFVRSVIKIRASVEETNMQEWVVTVNGVQIPNDAASSTVFSADFDPSTITNDGTINIVITAKDQAENTASKNISLTLDRVSPTIQIVYPRPDTVTRSGQDLTILIDFNDASSSSLDKNGIDVIAKTTSGAYITRVTFVSLRSTNGGTQRWTGRIRYKKGLLPSRFVLSASAVDRAGNAALVQESTVRYGN